MMMPYTMLRATTRVSTPHEETKSWPRLGRVIILWVIPLTPALHTPLSATHLDIAKYYNSVRCPLGAASHLKYDSNASP